MKLSIRDVSDSGVISPIGTWQLSTVFCCNTPYFLKRFAFDLNRGDSLETVSVIHLLQEVDHGQTLLFGSS